MATSTAVHRLAVDVLELGAPYPLALAGGRAALVHGLLSRAGDGLCVATESAVRMELIAAALVTGLTERGWAVRVRPAAGPLAVRLLVAGADVTGERDEECVVDVVKEVLWRPLTASEAGPVLSVEDLVGIAVRDLADRGLARDLVVVRAAARAHWSLPELEELGHRHAPEVFDLADLRARLEAVELVDDHAFLRCGLDDTEVGELRRWVQEWADDIGERLLEAGAPEDE
jgi:hypothetical protein